MNARLDGFPLLEDLTEQERATLARYLEERACGADEQVFGYGWEGDELLLIAEGRVRLELDGQVLGALGPGESLGTLAIVSVGARECDAVAELPTRLLRLTRQSYLRLRSDDPAVALRLQEAILRRLAGHVREALRERATSEFGD